MTRRRRKKKLPEAAVFAEIESFAHDGRGITHVDGKVTFVDGALPGEKVEFIYTDIRRDYAAGRVEKVIESSSLRVEPKCEYYGVCGGCSFQHLESNAQIGIKQKILSEQLARIGKLSEVAFWPPLTGSYWGYRYKARLGAKYVAKKGRVLVGFHEKGKPYIADMVHCDVLHPAIGDLLGQLSELIGSLSTRSRTPQVEIAIGDNVRAMVFRVLDDTTETDTEILRVFGEKFGFDVYLQPHGPDSVFSLTADPLRLLEYQLPEHSITCYFDPMQFTQVNPEINRKMVNRALELLQLGPDDKVIDLFCGLGNFTLPIARYAGCVVGVEGARSLVDRAGDNARRNGLYNVEFYVANLDNEVDNESWCQSEYTHALLDPSRAGAQNILKYLPRWGVKRIVYVSCNPATLARDSGVLVNQLGYTLRGAGVMDMFPQTAHVESIALFEK